MKTVAYMPIHYGTEYLQASLLSLVDQVDEFIVLYTPIGSQGHRTDTPPPDSKEEIYQIARDVLKNKLLWIEGEYHSEGEHRDKAFQYARHADVLLGIDADEVYEPKDIENTIKTIYDGPHRHYGVNGFINHWRSFDWALYDSFRPIRGTNMQRDRNAGQGEIMQRIYHFSCAQKEATIRYKWLLSGHAVELRPDWFDTYINWKPDSDVKWLHPVSLQIWEKPEFFDKTQMPDYLKNHQNYNLSVIP